MEEAVTVVNRLIAGEAVTYKEAVDALESVQRNRHLIESLRRRDSANNRQKVVYELGKAVGDRITKEIRTALSQLATRWNATSSAGEDPARIEDTAETVAPEQEPAAPAHVITDLEQTELDALEVQKGQLTRQRAQLSNQLADVPEADRAALVNQVLALDEEVRQLFTRQRNIALGQVEPEPTAAEPDAAPRPDRAELEQTIRNLRTRISKARKAHEEARTAEKRAGYAEKLAKLQLEMEQMEMAVKAWKA